MSIMNKKVSLLDKDYEGIRTSIIEKLQELMPEYTDLSSTDAGIVLLELFAGSLDITNYYLDVASNEAFLPTSLERGNVIKHCSTIAYSLSNRTPAKFKQVFEIEINPIKDTIIPKGFKVKTPADFEEDSIIFELDRDHIIPKGKSGLEKDQDGYYLYEVPITQGYTIPEDVLGSSIGTQDQTFILNFKPAIVDSVKVYVNEGAGFEPWTRVDSFINSTKDSKHYFVTLGDDDIVSVTFGNNLSGKIPEKGFNNIIATYRVGGGSLGNVGTNIITEQDSPLAFIKSTTNPFVAYLPGVDNESIEEAKIKAPASIRTLNRCVTLEDFKDVCLQLPEVSKCASVKSSSIEGWVGNPCVVITVLPKDMEVLSDELKTKIEVYIEDRRLIKTEATIVNPYYKEVEVSIEITAFPSYENSLIKSEALSILSNLLSIQNFDFGADFNPNIIVSELYKIKGVRYSNIISPVGILTPKEHEIIKVTNIVVTVRGGIE